MNLSLKQSQCMLQVSVNTLQQVEISISLVWCGIHGWREIEQDWYIGS